MRERPFRVLKSGELEICWQGPGWYRRSRERPRFYLVCAIREANPANAVWATKPEELPGCRKAA
jgi:hypothetical protein